MTCFWDGLIKALNIDMTPVLFVDDLIKRNCKTTNVKWNNELLTDQNCQENLNAIKELNSSKLNNGYDCSTFDPVLFLVSELYSVNIHHTYDHHVIEYINSLSDRTIKVYSNRSHFWA